MRLSQLLPAARTEAAGRDIEVTGLTADSRAVVPGCLFAALPGSRADGRAFIADALARGAAAVLAPEGTVLPEGSGAAVLVTDREPRLAFARAAAAFHGRQPDAVAAVTGTNGKTSTVTFARRIWSALGHRAASLGTLGVAAPGMERYGAMTTPDPVTLHAVLADLADAGIDRLAMEASSHGLDQYRLDGVRLAAAGFTNLTRDHLDYHGTMEAYFAAKAALFDRVLAPGGCAVLNADIPEFDGLSAICTRRDHRVLGYGFAGRELTVRSVEPLPHGQRLSLTVLGEEAVVDLPLVGRFQAWNAMCALGLVIGTGGDAPSAVRALVSLEGVPGRLQHVATHPNGAPVFVDYAHTPDALETVLTALRPHAAGRLVVVFGCGGDRDRGKRPVMGELAGRLADRAIVTDDNPRTEVPAAIRREVMAGCPAAEEIGDRRTAIRTAVAGLQPGDVLVIAGKGHEQGQTIGTEVRPFDDAAEARAAAAECGA
ncbi:UDP-N-acetylmuramoyl-L-alanyl-D-glutamate--2,6-diaminopimelate ligase [Azospirillum halopraeferens]|uniref:UDP-N-acetylmuramoyl-L-alanyl-D-glutamate--2, 6-diaminopimelate ligase n=1 Tax=Azospirillum halopraeferens TaxID=34010 RepID=UPI0004038D64|nr:UDP-N-acetylmuramoyl-L-alanyl-D-glutamate--2,6-diaminopimelate ligase [Azospirillum halopraeferens]